MNIEKTNDPEGGRTFFLLVVTEFEINLLTLNVLLHLNPKTLVTLKKMKILYVVLLIS